MSDNRVDFTSDDITDIDIRDESLYDYSSPNLPAKYFDKSQQLLRQKVLTLIDGSPAYLDFLQRLVPKEALLNVSISEYAKSMIAQGKWIFQNAKDGSGMLPTLYDTEAKHFAEQVRLSSSKVTPELGSSLTSLAMQHQIGQILERLDDLNNTVGRIETGQRNDRYGLFFSARQQFIEAIGIASKDLQAHALLGAAHTADDARFQLIMTMRDDINQVIANSKLSKKNRDELSNNVIASMAYINGSLHISLNCYSALGETNAVTAVLKSHQVFIKQCLLAKGRNGLSIAENLHQNWNGKDGTNINRWLEIPKEIVERIEDALEDKRYCEIESDSNKKELS